MSSQANPESPYMDSRLQAAFGVRTPGTPTSSGKPGVQAADVSFPAPPGVNAAAPGRPATPQAPTPQAATPAATPGAAAGPAAAPGGQPSQPGQKPITQAGSGPAMAAVPGTVGALPRLPGPAELPMGGATLATPYGVANRGADGQAQLSSITPEGAQRYREVAARTSAQLGPLPRIFRQPGLPEMSVEPGKWNYSPFTGRWSR